LCRKILATTRTAVAKPAYLGLAKRVSRKNKWFGKSRRKKTESYKKISRSLSRSSKKLLVARLGFITSLAPGILR
jgi:hypothetical protein